MHDLIPPDDLVNNLDSVAQHVPGARGQGNVGDALCAGRGGFRGSSEICARADSGWERDVTGVGRFCNLSVFHGSGERRKRRFDN